MKAVANPFKHEFELAFEVEAEYVTERDIFGALYGQTDIIGACSLSSLQKDGKAGKCILEKRNDGKYVLRIPVTASPPEIALLATEIESIDNVAGRPTRFKLVELYNRRSKMVGIALRARELMKRIGQDGEDKVR